jgi:hypothetical protein
MENIFIFYDHLNYFMPIWYNLWQLGTVGGHLVYFSHFGMLDQEKSGNPGKYRVEIKLSRLPAINKLRMYNPGYKQFLLPSAAALSIALL